MTKAPATLPVTVLSGFLGAGKTTVLQHILAQSDRRLAVIVNDMSEVNIDATKVKGGQTSLTRADESLVEMSNGCICCTLRDDLLVEVSKLAKAGRFDGLVIESTGISEPVPVAQTFAFRDEDGYSLSDLARLDTMVTVVDAGAFLKDVGSGDRVDERGESLGEGDDRSVAGLLVEQVEFADVVVINKRDRVDEAGLAQVEAAVRTLNRGARIVVCEQGRVPLSAVIDTGLFDPEVAAGHAGWIKELQAGEHTPETELYGINSLVYRARRPFDSQKLWDWFHRKASWKGVLRAKGFFWFGARPQLAWELAQAGGSTQITPSGFWWAAVDRDRWPQPDGERPDQVEDWHPIYGDRLQELVFIGLSLDADALRASLDACLVPEPEARCLEALRAQPDPFPSLQDAEP